MIGLLCIALSCLLLKETSAADTTVIAAVFNGAPVPNSDIATNLNTYKALLKTDARIIVFPEYGFTGFQVDSLDKFSISIKDNGTVDGNLTSLNDYAKEKKAYVVANVLEKDGDDFYSTTVVLNGSANIVAKYRKINTNSSEVNLKAGSDIVTFEIDTLGKIGLISGDDILYENPAKNILTDGVNTIIYTAAFRSIAPFKTALSIQQGYAQANGINLLVANLNDPPNGLGGSGVYYQNQIVKTLIDGNSGTKALPQITIKSITNKTVCQKPSASVQVFTNFNVLVSKGTDKDIKSFNLTYAPVEWISQNISKNINETEVCDGDFCCTFKVEASSWSKNELYRIAVKNGANSMCALLWCDKDGNGCGKRVLDSIETKFSFIQIVYKKSDRSFRPYTLRNDLQPIQNPEKTTYFCQNDNDVNFNTTVASFDNIVVFGIVTDSGASSLNVLMGVQLMLLVTVLKFFFANP